MDEKVLNKANALKNKKEKGASLVEYALLVALIAVVCIVAIRVLGQNISSKFSDVATQIAS